ncbi:hypothetical protein DFH07DRAFT_770703 [Mycena maculata]|uniref:Myb/SANT-like domain-containing protein n=1 Tax=Mycena maculata TaxID=230809 RepID=A0AAD7NJ15_9AGAR|nr:hypothetical protein DFH07DRAFT_770703 [Mycena maculata]
MPKAKAKDDTLSNAGNDGGPSKTARKRDKCTAGMMGILIQVLVAEKKLGRQAESGWTSESYNRVVVALKAAGIIRDSKQVKSCWTRTKGQYKVMKEMLGLSGFGLDPKTKALTAEEEVWDAYLAKHPKRKPFKHRPFPHYDDMALLCDDVMATGEDTFSNGASGGNQGLDSDVLNDIDNSFGAGGAGDDADDEEDEEDDEPGRDVFSNISNDSASSASTPQPKALKNVAPVSSQKVGSKRSRHGRMSSMSVLAGLATSVETLAASFQEESQSKLTSDSPARRNKAWNAMLAEEGADLSDTEFAAAVEVFSKTICADQYLQFPADRKGAHRVWLNTAIARTMGI